MELLSTKDFMFDADEAIKTGFYESGTVGSGKSDVAMMCIDELRKKGVVCIIFDPSQDWMRRYHNAQIVQFNTEPLSKNLFNITLKDTIILDISNMTILQTQEFVELFCRLIYKAQVAVPPEKRKYYFILFEEAHTEFPQGILRAKRMQNVVRILTQGRNFNIRVGAITQFAAVLDKMALRYMKQRYFGWTDEPNDVSYIGSWIGDENAESLKFFKEGEFLYSFPSKNILEKIYISPYDYNNQKLLEKIE